MKTKIFLLTIFMVFKLYCLEYQGHKNVTFDESQKIPPYNFGRPLFDGQDSISVQKNNVKRIHSADLLDYFFESYIEKLKDQNVDRRLKKDFDKACRDFPKDKYNTN